MAVTETSSSQRLHHLDALRAFAMLLGIALHAGLAYSESYGWVVDPERVPALRHLLMAVHGFRMQLFFLLAGCFTAMLARRSSPRELLRHRAQRVLLPLVLACLTVLPVLRCVQQQAEGPFLLQTSPTTPIDAAETAVVKGDTASLDRLLVAASEEQRTRLLSIAAACGHMPVVDHWLRAGVAVDARAVDGSTALHAAAMYGQRAMVARLLEAGADIASVDSSGHNVLDALERDRAATVTIAMQRGQPVDWAAIREGRAAVRDLLMSRGAKLDHTTPTSDLTITSMLREPFLEHLWFLWFLWLYIVGYAAVRSVAHRLPTFHLPDRPGSGVAMLLLTMALIGAMFPDRVWDIGAPTTLSLLPDMTVLAYYGAFFAVGVRLHGRPDGMQLLARGWKAALLLAPMAFVAAQGFVEQQPWTRQFAPDATLWRLASLLFPALFAWLMIIGLMGAFARALPRPSATVRYLSDAAYWSYLAHMPLVLALQLALRSVALPGVVKFALVVSGSIALLLLSYAWLVRPTWVGRLLNGSRAGQRVSR